MPSKLDATLCARCKGAARLCGRPVCPILKRYIESVKASPMLAKRELEGATPPSVIVGEYGYPSVRLGPVAVPEVGEGAKRYEDYRAWWGRLTLEDIIALRASTVYSSFTVRVRMARGGNKLLEATREAALSVKPVDAEYRFVKPPSPRLTFDGLITPTGLRGWLEDIRIVGNPAVPRKVDQLVEDYGVKAREAVAELYRAGFDNYYLTRLLSLGLLGQLPARRIVPTRWAITAVDKMLGDLLLREVKRMPEYPNLVLHYSEYIGNRYAIVLAPGSWSFEMIEIWLPRSVWVKAGEPYIAVNYELHDGRARAPEVDGGYHAIRLPVLEHLHRVGRQATVVAIREVTPAYYAPVGSWQIRESVRAALSSPPVKLDSVEHALSELARRLETRVDIVVGKSRLLKRLLKPDARLL
ncbi:MAG: Nre family DNA repair protein [Thermofilaceae archaeon]